MRCVRLRRSIRPPGRSVRTRWFHVPWQGDRRARSQIKALAPDRIHQRQDFVVGPGPERLGGDHRARVHQDVRAQVGEPHNLIKPLTRITDEYGNVLTPAVPEGRAFLPLPANKASSCETLASKSENVPP
jgi:hypothetical protein